MSMMFILNQIEFDIKINKDELLENIWEHKKKKKRLIVIGGAQQRKAQSIVRYGRNSKKLFFILDNKLFKNLPMKSPPL
jgi:hypothetical protein